MGTSGVLAGLDWDITIRGILVVATGTAVLMGSVWLLLATNTGIRVGALLAFAGFFGWMFVMGVIWWIFGIGWRGEMPVWQPLDINYGQLAGSPVEVARRLTPPGQLPRAYDLVLASDDEAARGEFASEIPADRLEGLTPAEQAEARVDWQRRNEATTLSELAAVAPDLTGEIDFGGNWRLLSTAESGEAVATASAVLIERDLFASPADFKVLNAFAVGGKPRLREDPSRWDRIAHEVSSMVRFLHPTHYTVVQVQQVIEQTAQPGEPPPRPVVDPDQPIVSVIMQRDLGSLRVPAALVTIGSLLLFIVFATMLHYRDKESMARRAALVEKR
jgi:hypothetical protein